MDTKRTDRSRRRPLLCVAVLGLLAGGCDQAGIRAYQAPKDAAVRRADAVEPASQGPPQIRWALPAGWQELAAGQMRVGHFAVSGPQGEKAQVTIIPLAGQGGGDVENVNRWRGQVGQTRLTEEEINKLAEPVQIAGAPGRLFDFAGKTPDEDKPTRLLAAVLHREGTAWFFKMIGDDGFVATQKAAFGSFLKSVTFEAGEGSGPVARAAAEAGKAPAMPAPAAAAPVASAAGGKPAWTVPAGWLEQAPGAMQTAKFSVAADGGKADITISVLPGDAGGKVPNINRWRGQIGLGPATEVELAKSLLPLEIPGAETYLVDVVADQTKRRVVAAAVARGGQTWFLKLLGDAAAVAHEKEAFLKFVHSVNYGN